MKVIETPIKAVIFDNDGTLLDTEWAYSWAHLQLTGEEMTWDLKPQFMGKSSIETCRQMIEKYHIDMTPEDLSVKRTDMLEECWKKVKILPGGLELVQKLKQMGIKLAIATSSRRHVYQQKIANHKDLEALFDVVVCGNEVTKGKPAPDIFLAALHKLGEDLSPSDAIVVGDSPLDIKAANDGNIPAVFVPDPHMDAEKSLAEQNATPILTIGSLVEFPFDKFNWYHSE